MARLFPIVAPVLLLQAFSTPAHVGPGNGPGLAVEGPNWEPPVRLVRIDPMDGRVVQSREIDPVFWRIAIAPLRTIPQDAVLR